MIYSTCGVSLEAADIMVNSDEKLKRLLENALDNPSLTAGNITPFLDVLNAYFESDLKCVGCTDHSIVITGMYIPEEVCPEFIMAHLKYFIPLGARGIGVDLQPKLGIPIHTTVSISEVIWGMPRSVELWK